MPLSCLFDFVDILAFERRDNKIGVAVLMVRDADLIDSKTFVVPSLEDDEEALSNFIAQYYSERAFIPKEILLPFEIEQKDSLESLLKERSGRKVILRRPKRGEKKDLLPLAANNLKIKFDQSLKKELDQNQLLEDLKTKLHLNKKPHRMECYDISNISGKNAVGSMVVFIDGQASKENYRKFKIKTLDTPNDYAMLYEVLHRRLVKSDSKWQQPDLILIDGGKGQLKIAETVLKELGITNIELAGIAKGQGQGARAKGIYDNKKQDEIFRPGRANPIKLRPQEAAMMTLQNLRDESHRFAIEYHRKLREKASQHSWLDDIPGIGPKTKAKLLQSFGSPDRIKKASKDDLMALGGVSDKLAEAIKALS